MKTHVLVAKQLKKQFFSPSPVEILKEVNLEVSAGESIAIVGKSGEGKSTLLHILGTIEKPTGGTLEICGVETSKASLSHLRNHNIGFVFQTFHLLEDYTVLDNVLIPARIARLPVGKGSAAYNRALELLDRVGLKERAHFLCKLLSGGEKQRAAIARALCNDPQLILADEPSGNLDSSHSQAIHSLLLDLVKQMNKSLIVVTHDKELSALCDRTLLLRQGKLEST